MSELPDWQIALNKLKALGEGKPEPDENTVYLSSEQCALLLGAENNPFSGNGQWKMVRGEWPVATKNAWDRAVKLANS